VGHPCRRIGLWRAGRNLALQARSYLDGDKRRFIHLVDGGVSDNLGLRGSTDSAVVYAGGSRPSPALQKARRIAVIIVDANTDPDYGWDSTERSPGFWADRVTPKKSCVRSLPI